MSDLTLSDNDFKNGLDKGYPLMKYFHAFHPRLWMSFPEISPKNPPKFGY